MSEQRGVRCRRGDGGEPSLKEVCRSLSGRARRRTELRGSDPRDADAPRRERKRDKRREDFRGGRERERERGTIPLIINV